MGAAAARQDSKPLPQGTATTPVRVQGNWKRRPGVATRYELALAVDRLLEQEKVEIDAGGWLRLARRCGGKREAVTAQERWARDDRELEAYCHRLEVHETRSAMPVYVAELRGSPFEASVFRGSPRRGVTKYVLRELRRAGRLDYAELVDTIFGVGGLEWVLEEAPRVWRGKSRVGR